jgi:hypothetical protein
MLARGVWYCWCVWSTHRADLSGLVGCTALLTLAAASNAVGSFAAVDALVANAHLRSLDLRDNPVTEGAHARLRVGVLGSWGWWWWWWWWFVLARG